MRTNSSVHALEMFQIETSHKLWDLPSCFIGATLTIGNKVDEALAVIDGHPILKAIGRALGQNLRVTNSNSGGNGDMKQAWAMPASIGSFFS